jgi:hypothetical protein
MGRCKEETGDLLGIEDFLIARRTAIAATVGSRKPLFSDTADARCLQAAPEHLSVTQL